MKRGRERVRKDGAEEVAQTLKARRVMVSRELERGGAHAKEESRSWEADGVGMMNASDTSSECEVERLEDHLKSYSERFRPKPTRACVLIKVGRKVPEPRTK